jgi:NDP-sugar pyrophosphorylase family protein
MKAMIFAAGLGTRLKPITDMLPKALVPVAGKPLIEHVCRKLKNAGIEEAVVNVHHFADKVENWVSDQHIMQLQISDERECLLETGGAVLHAREYLQGCGRFLIHNVDILSNLDLGWFESSAPMDAMASLLVSRRKTSRMLLFDPETMRLVGWHNTSTGQIRSPFEDIDPGKCLALAFSGIHIMSDRVFGQMQTYAQKHGLTISGYSPKFPVIDFYLWACAGHKICGVLAEDLELVDVGKLDTLGVAEDFISRNL